MFDFVRKHTRVMQLLLFVLIVPSFVLFGLEGYSRFQEKGETVARVDGRDITQQEWDEAHRREVEQLRQQMPNIDSKLLDSPAARYGTLERIVRERVLAAAVEKGHMEVGDQRVARELQRNQQIAALRTPDGKLDVERYRALLAAQGMTPQMFENQVRRDLALRQVLNGVNATGFTPAAQAGVSLGGFFERREAQVARFAAADYLSKVEASDAELDAYYKANPQQFQSPEQASIEYVMLDIAAMSRDVAVNETDLKTYYEQNAARLGGGTPEERRASHILVKVAPGAPAADKEKARAKAEQLLAQVKKNPESFADVAKKNSEDPGSAAQGGDLDFFARGAMTKAFEDAVFAMKAKGEIAGPVETEFGYHVIRLTDLKAAKVKTYEDIKPQLEADFKRQQAQKKYSDAAETFSNDVYEQPDSLKPVADKLKLEIKTANVTRQPAQGVTGALANPKFLEALFGSEAVERKRNTAAMEVGPNQMVSGRIVKHEPARTKPLEEVKAQVRERVLAQKAAELARKDGAEKLAAWKAAPAGANLPAAVALSRQDTAKQPREVVEAALRADPSALPAWTGVDLGAEGYAVVKVNKVLPRETPPAEQAVLEQQQYARAWAAAESQAYYNMLKDRFKVQIKAAKPAETPAQ